MAQFISINSFCPKNILLKSLYLGIMSNLTHFKGRNTEVKFMSRILEQIYVGFETGTGSGAGFGSENNHSGYTTLLVREVYRLLYTPNLQYVKAILR
jgi:hypothetical protein